MVTYRRSVFHSGSIGNFRRARKEINRRVRQYAARARENFESFSPSARKAFLYWINNVKSPAKRAERIAETVRRTAE